MKRFQRQQITRSGPQRKAERPARKPGPHRGETPDEAALQRAIANPRAAQPADILALQSVYGNRAVQRLLAEAHGRPLSSGGHQMPPVVRRKMELAFGADFSGVRVHQGTQAQTAGALAFTRGADIHFAPGRYQPHHTSGQSLLAHELAHVVQQRAAAVGPPQPTTFVQSQGLEREANSAGERAAHGQAVRVRGASHGAQGKFPKEGPAGQEKSEKRREKIAGKQEESRREAPKEFKFRTILNQLARTYFQSFKTRAQREAREKGIAEAEASRQLQQIDRYVDDLSESIAKAWAQWAQLTVLAEIQISGPMAIFKPGSLQGPPLDALLMAANPPLNTPKEAGYTRTFAEGLANNWQLWHMGSNGSLPLYPAFAAWPGPIAPPMPNTPLPLKLLPSSGDKMMEHNELYAEISKGSRGDPLAAGIFNAMSHAVVDVFKLWRLTQMITHLMGGGPVPTFAPPMVPVGPVVDGSAFGIGCLRQ